MNHAAAESPIINEGLRHLRDVGVLNSYLLRDDPDRQRADLEFITGSDHAMSEGLSAAVNSLAKIERMT